jgi:hypothetical protein
VPTTTRSSPLIRRVVGTGQFRDDAARDRVATFDGEDVHAVVGTRRELGERAAIEMGGQFERAQFEALRQFDEHIAGFVAFVDDEPGHQLPFAQDFLAVHAEQIALGDPAEQFALVAGC